MGRLVNLGHASAKALREQGLFGYKPDPRNPALNVSGFSVNRKGSAARTEAVLERGGERGKWCEWQSGEGVLAASLCGDILIP